MMKNKFRYGCFAIILFIIPTICFSQNTTEELESEVIENAAEGTEDFDFNYDTYTEKIKDLLKHPLNINTATYDELAYTGLLDEMQIINLIEHRKYYGPLLNLYELQTIEFFDLDDIIRIRPYIKIDNGDDKAIPFLQQLYKGDYQLFIRTQKVLEQQAGYDEDTASLNYSGNEYRLYSRFKYNYENKISYGFTAEKDPGERLYNATQPAGIDYLSAHFFRRSEGLIKAIALGDYEINIGQGLIIWSGFAVGKSVYPISIRRTVNIVSPYTSVNENRFLRGAALTVGNQLQVTAFGSYNQIDANASLVDTINEDVLEISSLQTSGLHRTENELADKDAITQMSSGIHLSYKTDQLNIGATGIYYQLSGPLSTDTDPYKEFDFSGDQLTNVGINYSYLWRNILFFGETAMSDNIKFGTLNGIIMPVDAKVDIAILHRYFDKSFQTLFASTFSENTLPQNEEGIYLGLELKPLYAWKLSSYIDLYKNEWLEFNADAPAYGTDILTQVTFQPNKSLETYIRFKNEVSDQNASASVTGDQMHDILVDQQKTNIRWNLNYKVSRIVSLRSRIDYVKYDEQISPAENGYLIYQDANFDLPNFPLSFETRFAIFNTDSYNTRIYVYENDVLYAYSIISYYGQGMRSYITLEYSPLKWLDTWFRISRTWYNDRDIIGSGGEEITDNKKTEVKLQVRLKW